MYKGTECHKYIHFRVSKIYSVLGDLILHSISKGHSLTPLLRTSKFDLVFFFHQVSSVLLLFE